MGSPDREEPNRTSTSDITLTSPYLSLRQLAAAPQRYLDGEFLAGGATVGNPGPVVLPSDPAHKDAALDEVADGSLEGLALLPPS